RSSSRVRVALLVISSEALPSSGRKINHTRRRFSAATLLKPKEEAGLKTEGAVGIVFEPKARSGDKICCGDSKRST
ncbi:hypothetical protein VIGAN_08305800, partial [Vigna angularis var. angularis]